MTPFSISFKNEYTVHEKTIKCTAKSNEFNLTYNPTILESGSLQNINYFATGSYFSPFVTTLGLYDEYNNLLAVARFGQPIPMSGKTDYNFIVKMDF